MLATLQPDSAATAAVVEEFISHVAGEAGNVNFMREIERCGILSSERHGRPVWCHYLLDVWQVTP